MVALIILDSLVLSQVLSMINAAPTIPIEFKFQLPHWLNMWFEPRLNMKGKKTGQK